MDSKEIRDFDRELIAPPGVQISRGADDLMAVMRQAKPPPRQPASKRARKAR